ncbi:MAG TPA: tRNA dihydrouridine synthase DusB [Acidimicrobiia bacterium]|nr:tRNA dihydrouridine synthase DusB [Acidimicrobiia bacterium]
MSTPRVSALRLGPLTVWPPVVLAPMAGVTNAPFRRLCRQHGAGLYVNEMIGAKALVHGDPKTSHLASFPPDESPRSIQLYGTTPSAVGEAVALLVGERGADHIDLNFGCPAPKITRHGGGAALPYRIDAFRQVVRAAVANAGEVPITVKYRKGIDDRHLTYLEAGHVAEEEGVAAVGLHARTAEQLYSGEADWSAIARLKAQLSIPVLGNGDIWEAADAIRMVRETGCDGVIVGRGCLGRPWLFGDLARAFEGDSTVSIPTLGEVSAVMREHARLLVEWFDLFTGIRSFRKHTGWYLKGYPAGPEVRRRLSVVEDLIELDEVLASLDPDALPHDGATRMARGHTHGPRPVRLPHRYLEGDWVDVGAEEAELAVSGG